MKAPNPNETRREKRSKARKEKSEADLLAAQANEMLEERTRSENARKAMAKVLSEFPIAASVERIKSGRWFVSGSNRKFMKLQDILPSGLHQTYVRLDPVSGEVISNFAINCVDEDGITGCCPYEMPIFYVASEDDLYADGVKGPTVRHVKVVPKTPAPPPEPPKTWYKVIKYFQGGGEDYQIGIPRGIRLTKVEWDEIMEWIGDNTNGGHNYGYRITRRRIPKQHPKLKVIPIPGYLTEKE